MGRPFDLDLWNYMVMVVVCVSDRGSRCENRNESISSGPAKISQVRIPD